MELNESPIAQTINRSRRHLSEDKTLVETSPPTYKLAATKETDMNFTLYYRGQLKSNGGPKEKHLLRKSFHPQLKTLWSQEPLSHFTGFYESPNPEDSIARRIG